MKSTTAIALVIAALLIVFVPLFALKGAEFGGADGQAGDIVNEITGEEYEPWFTPPLERAIGGGLPGEIESLFFCLQTAIGVGIIAYSFGYLVARKKYGGDTEKNKEPCKTIPGAEKGSV